VRRMSVLRSLAIFLCTAAIVARAQDAPTGKWNPPQTAMKSADAITREQADAILAELHSIRVLLERQELRAAAAQSSRAPAPPERVTLSLAGASQWYSQGSADAPVTIVEFTDFQCPYCRRFDQNTFAELKRNYIETGKVRFLARDLPLEFHANAQRAAEAARCAGDQGKYWEMRQALFAGGGELGRDAIVKHAQTLSIDADTFAACLDTEKHKSDIQADLADSARLRITGTPTFVIGKSGKDVLEGVRINGALPLAAFDAAIQKALGATP